jgi:hypothetical protein
MHINMSRNKSKAVKNHPHPDPKQDCGGEKSNNRHVYIEPGAQIDFVQDLKQKYDSAQRDDNTNKAKQLFWTQIAATLLLITAFFAGWQTKIASKTFNATVRPYVGEEGVSYMYFAPSPDGSMKQSPIWIPEATSIQLKIPIKNFGPVPATNFKADWKVFFGGTEVTMGAIPALPATLYPTQEVYFQGGRSGPDYIELINGKKLTMQTTVEYDSPSKHEKECQEYQYLTHVGFVSLGACK